MRGDKTINLGRNIRFFGDGFQSSKLIGERRYWRVPVMDGEFLCEESIGYSSAVGGGNFLVLAASQIQALNACEAAIDAMRKLPNIIMPFPGGVTRSGSKIGSKYSAVPASTNQAYCPTLKGMTDTQLTGQDPHDLIIRNNCSLLDAIGAGMETPEAISCEARPSRCRKEKDRVVAKRPAAGPCCTHRD